MSTEQGPGATEQTLNAFNLTPRPPIGCVECRTRGLQCDSDPETLRQACSSCVRNGYICSRLMAGVNATRPARTTPRKGVEKRRIQTACNWCRKQKIRCSGDTPCGACIIRNQHCVYTAVHRQHTGDGDDSILQNDWNSGLPRYDVPGQDVMDVTPSTNLQPDQIYQAPAPIIRQGPLPKAAGKTQPDFQ